MFRPSRLQKPILLLAFIISFLFLAKLPSASADTIVPGGSITTDTFWTLAGSPYIVQGNIVLDAGVNLAIEAGVVVKFDGYYTLRIDGNLIANGSSSQLITFTSNQSTPVAGSWNKIFFNGPGSTNSQVSYWLVQYGNDGVAVNNSSPTIDHVIVSDQNSVGFNIMNGASPTISYSTARNIGGYGVWIGHDGVADPRPIFNYCNFYNNGLYNVAFSSYFDSNTVLDFKNNWWGTTDINQIQATILDHNDIPPWPTVDFIPFLNSENGEPVLYVYNISRSPTVIDHFEGQTVSVGYDLSINSTVTLKIYDELNNNLVRTLVENVPRSAGQNSEIWDGKDEKGELLPYEAYYVDIEAVTKNQTYHYIDPMGDSPSPGQFGPSVTNPDFNPFQNETVSISYTVPNAGRQPVNILSSINQLLKQIVDDRPKPPGPRTDRWDGRKANGQIFSGSYHFQFPQSVRLRHNTIILQSSQIPALAIAANPFLIIPTHNEVSTLGYELSETASVTVTIRDPLGNHFRTLLSNTAQNAGQYSLLWDGKNDFGEYPNLEGDYQIIIETYNAQNGLTLQSSGNVVVAL